MVSRTGLRAAAVAWGLFVLVARGAADLALPRPAGDCISPPIETFTTFSFFPSDYQIRSLEPATVSADRLSTKVDVATDFNVRYFGPYKIVTNERANETYLLYQCGTPNPADLAPGTIPGVDLAAAKVFEIPLRSVASGDTTADTFLSQLGVQDRVAFASPYAVNPCMQKLANVCNKVSADTFTTGSIGKQAPQVDGLIVSDADPNPKSIAFTASSDPGPLNRAEWIKFLAPFFNKEIEANAIFDQAAASYNATKAAVAAVAGPTKPTVAWVASMSNTDGGYDGPPDGMNYVFYFPAYKNAYIRDAGAATYNSSQLLSSAVVAAAPAGVVVPDPYNPDNVLVNASAGAAAAHAVLLIILDMADVILDETAYANVTTPNRTSFLDAFNISAAEAQALPALRDDRAYTTRGRVSPSGGSDSFDSMVARPQDFLAALAAVITPAANVSTNAPKYLLPLDASPSTNAVVVSPATCPDLVCTPRAAAEAICPTAYKNCSGELVHAEPATRCATRPVCAASGDASAPSPAPMNAAASSTGLLGAAFGAVAGAAALLLA